MGQTRGQAAAGPEAEDKVIGGVTGETENELTTRGGGEGGHAELEVGAERDTRAPNKANADPLDGGSSLEAVVEAALGGAEGRVGDAAEHKGVGSVNAEVDAGVPNTVNDDPLVGDNLLKTAVEAALGGAEVAPEKPLLARKRMSLLP